MCLCLCELCGYNGLIKILVETNDFFVTICITKKLINKIDNKFVKKKKKKG